MTFSDEGGLGDVNILDVYVARAHTCPRCHLSLPPLTDGKCRGCNRLKNRRTYATHQYAISQRRKADRKANPEKYRRVSRRYYANNIVKEAERKRKHNAARRAAAND